MCGNGERKNYFTYHSSQVNCTGEKVLFEGQGLGDDEKGARLSAHYEPGAAMMQWHMKAKSHHVNARRFFRVNIEARAFVVPSSSLNYLDIYATGAQYYTPNIESHLEALKGQIGDSLTKIRDNKELVYALTNEFLSRIDFFHECVKKVSNGLCPTRDLSYSSKTNSFKNRIDEIEKIRPSSPKSYALFKHIEEFLMHYFLGMINTVKHSTPQYFFPVSPKSFKAEEFISSFNDEKQRNIPFLQLIRDLTRLIKAHTDVYRQISFDTSEKGSPQNWETSLVSMSEGGIALPLNKRFEQRETVDVSLHLKLTNRLVLMRGEVVNVYRIKGNPFEEKVAINYVFPEGKMQAAIRKEIQEHEVSPLMSKKMVGEG